MLTTQNPDPTAQKPFFLIRPFVSVWQWLVPPSQAHADRQSGAARYIAAALAILICLGLVAAALFKGRDWHRGIKTFLSNRGVERSKKYEAADKPVEALIEANKSYNLAPDNPNAVRHVARYATMLKRHEAVYLWKRLDALGAMTDEDVDWSIRAMAALKDDASAIDEIEDLLAKRRPSAQLAQTADTVLQNLGRTKQLIEILTHYTESRPNDLDLKALLGMRLVQFGAPSEAIKGIDLLWKVAEDDHEPGRKALEFLYKLKLDSDSDQNRLIDRLEHHPLATEDDRIASIRRMAERRPEMKAQLMDKAIADRQNAPREKLPPLLRWINDEREYERVIAFLQPREAQVQDYLPLLSNYLNALTLTKRYKDLERLVNDPRTRLTTAERNMHRMHLAYVEHKDDPVILQKLIGESLESVIAENRTEMVLVIANYAKERGMMEEARKAYHAASLIRKIERDGFEGVLQLSYQMGDTKSFLDAATEAARRWPDNTTYQERYLYACLLTGQELETATVQVTKLLEARPKDTQRKFLMALACYRMKDSEGSLRVMQHTDLEQLTPGEFAVFCGLMRATNEKLTAQAQQIASQLTDKISMLPEEHKFLDYVRK